MQPKARDRANGHAEDETKVTIRLRGQIGPRHHTGHPDDLSPTVDLAVTVISTQDGFSPCQPSLGRAELFPSAAEQSFATCRTQPDGTSAFFTRHESSVTRYAARPHTRENLATDTPCAEQPSRGRDRAASPTSHTIAPYRLRTVGRRTRALQTEPSQSRQSVCLLSWTRIREVVRGKDPPKPTL